MPILAVYQQSFTAATLATYTWSFQLRRVMKTKQSSRFVIKINNINSTASSIVPATSNNQLILYMSNPELCGGVNSQAQTPTGIVNFNKSPMGIYTSVPQAVFVCNEFPVNPIVFNAEYSSTQAAPTGGNIAFTTIFTIIEFDGDIPDSVIT